MHGDDRTWKLVCCLYGEVFLAVADLRPGSRTFKSVFTRRFQAEEGWQALIPPGCVNGHKCLSEFSLFAYKQSHTYTGAQNQVSVRWNDPALRIPWPGPDPILSERDRLAPLTA
jgi:dTDP-4-dehydrorhamnose 3,5-epimerase